MKPPKLLTETAREKCQRANAARLTRSGGRNAPGGDMGGRRPRHALRCPCGLQALSRALARGSPDAAGLFACCRRAA